MENWFWQQKPFSAVPLVTMICDRMCQLLTDFQDLLYMKKKRRKIGVIREREKKERDKERKKERKRERKKEINHLG